MDHPSNPSEPGAGPALWLVRHGESTWNATGLAQGHNDLAELTSRGLEQASDAARQFRDRPIRAIYTSDLRRARQTAAAFSATLSLPVFSDSRLRERSLGVLEGAPSATIGPSVTGLDGGRAPGRRRVRPGPVPPGGRVHRRAGGGGG